MQMERTTLTPPVPNIQVRYDNLIIEVDPQPIGGYRGPVGTLSITHEQKKSFTDWTAEDLHNLAYLTNALLYHFEKRNVVNTLVYARQDGAGNFKLSLVPYPKCNWIEKIQGMIHVIFGSPALNPTQIAEVTQTFKSFGSYDRPPEQTLAAPQQDAFCREEVIKKQKIVSLEDYYILHDNRPRGATKDDPHLLIVPSAVNGHVDGSGVPLEQRENMFKIAQKTMQVLLDQKKFSTFLFLERCGTQLRGVPHQHMHVIGIQQFPATLLEKVKVICRQVWVMITPALSVEELKTRIAAFSSAKWN
jgi:diadenosine tetraphosphate (Ap4A) HIT family hydrolase